MKIILKLLMLLLISVQAYSQEENKNSDTITITQFQNKQTNDTIESISFVYQRSLSCIRKELNITIGPHGITAQAATINEKTFDYKTDARIQYDSLNFEELVEMFNKCLQIKLKNSHMIFLDGDKNCITYSSGSGRISISFSQPSQVSEQRGLKDFLELRSKIISICHQTDEIMKR